LPQDAAIPDGARQHFTDVDVNTSAKGKRDFLRPGDAADCEAERQICLADNA
jgi:hypothetical protein